MNLKLILYGMEDRSSTLYDEQRDSMLPCADFSLFYEHLPWYVSANYDRHWLILMGK